MQRTSLCPLYIHKRICTLQLGMSAMGQKRTSRSSLDHLVGCDQNPRRNVDAERLRGFKVKDCLEFGRGLNWQIVWFVATQNTVNIGRRQPEIFILVNPIGHEAAGRHKKIKHVDSGQLASGCKREEEVAMQQ